MALRTQTYIICVGTKKARKHVKVYVSHLTSMSILVRDGSETFQQHYECQMNCTF